FVAVSRELAGPAHPALPLVVNEEQAELVGNLTQPLQIPSRSGAHAAFSLDRLDKDRRGLLADRCAHLVQIAKGDVIEALHRRPETLEIGLVARRSQGRQGAAVEP